MNRLSQWVACVVVGSMFMGCGGGGLDEGVPNEIPKNVQSAESKAFMEQNLKNMTGMQKGKPQYLQPAPKEKTP
jgi:hypothetical protein